MATKKMIQYIHRCLEVYLVLIPLDTTNNYAVNIIRHHRMVYYPLPAVYKGRNAGTYDTFRQNKKEIKHILLYNHFQNKDHSLVLLSAC